MEPILWLYEARIMDISNHLTAHAKLSNATRKYSESMTQRHPIQCETTFLVTIVTKNRQPVFDNGVKARIAIETLYQIQTVYGFFLFGFVIMPDHVHLLLWPPAGASISKIMQIWKRAVSFNIGQGPLWQRRFHIRLVRNPHAALHYIHRNPVVSEMVKTADEYPWSSASERWDVVPFDAVT